MKILHGFRVPALGLSAALIAACGGGGGGTASDPGGGGGGGGGGDATLSADLSAIEADADFGVRADGTTTVSFAVILRDTDGNPLPGQLVELDATGDGNILVQPTGTSDADGRVVGTLASTVAESKTVTARVNPGPDEVALAGSATTEFVLIPDATFFVRMGGDDNNDGQSPAEAWRTIGRAAGNLLAGDTLYVGGGTYPESVTFAAQGTEAEPILILADTDGVYTSDPGEVMIDAGGSEFGLRLDGAKSVLVRGFCVTNAMIDTQSGAGFWLDGSTDCAILECAAFRNTSGIVVDGGSGTVLEGNQITNNVGTFGDGIVVRAGAQAVLTRNLVYNNARHGLLVSGSGGDVIAELGTFYLNAGDQVRVTATSGSFELRENIISDGLALGVHFDAAAAGNEHDNLFFGNSAGAFSDNEGGLIDLSSNVGDPLFVDPDGSDGLLGGHEGADDLFQVDSGSPAIDAGARVATAVELPFGGPISGFTSRLDGVLDGVGADGPAINFGFHYPATVDPFVSLTAGDARIHFAREDEVQPFVRIWQDDQLTWTEPSKIQPANATVRWMVSKVSPDVDEELLAVFSDDGTTTGLYLRRWDGSAWNEANAFTPNLGGSISSADSGQRGFDIEYEDSTGHALFVVSNGTPVPQFRTLVNGTWSTPAAVFGSALSTGTILWVELVARIGSDEIAMVALDSDETLMAAVWDGEAWGAPAVLDTQVAELRDSQCFDVAFESLSGDLLIAWGFTTDINNQEEIRYVVKPASSGAFPPFLQNVSAEAEGQVVRLAADPVSDRIVAALGEGDNGDDTVGMVWDGSAWGDIAELDITSSLDQDDMAVAWIGTTGEAILIYRDDDGGDTLDWAILDSAGWKKQPDALLPMGDWEKIDIKSFVNRDGVLAVALDAAGDLWAMRYDGIEWVLTNGGQPVGTSLATDGIAEAFAFDFRR